MKLTLYGVVQGAGHWRGHIQSNTFKVHIQSTRLKYIFVVFCVATMSVYVAEMHNMHPGLLNWHPGL